MIKIEILNSNDLLRTGEYVFYKNYLTIGSHHTSDLFINSDGLDKSHSTLFLKEGKLYVGNMDKEIYLHVNGKKTKGQKLLNKEDLFELKSVEIKIIDYSITPTVSTQNYIEDTIVSLKKENHPALDFLLPEDSIDGQ